MTIDKRLLSRLAEFDTPTICNVIELFDVRPRDQGFMDRRIQACFPELPPIVGWAAPAAFRSAMPPEKGDAYASLEKQLEQLAQLPGPAIVVIQDLDDPPVAAVFGEVMCATYQAFGARGLVTNGAGRDWQQVRALRFPVFTGGAIASHGYCHLLHLGMPVRIGSLVVRQGDLLHADANGVAKIPLEIAEQVADVAPEFVAAEALVLDYVKSPGPKSVSEFTERRRAFQDAVERIVRRIRPRG